ncbi:hypothetical protein DAEQUDRAFT_139570 [Daedalea quercina L-15889]|uniref:Uncharacterized protein n=1 Tax=Daedalea quercina L-15889 TaxID=1314783 RepID=A0A165RTP2_9APHY|nr:hypothetical protein DAEQUDRAFT_139570 [Daedalea quercina L-15889]
MLLHRRQYVAAVSLPLELPPFPAGGHTEASPACNAHCATLRLEARTEPHHLPAKGIVQGTQGAPFVATEEAEGR